MGLCHERLLDLMACHWLGRLAKSRRTETEAGAMGRTFQQSSSANCGESHLGATSSSASTPAHARTHDQRPPLRVARRPCNFTARSYSIGTFEFPLWLALQPRPAAATLRSPLLQLLDRHSPPKRRPTTSTALSSAALRSCLARQLAPPRHPSAPALTALAPRTRALHQ